MEHLLTAWHKIALRLKTAQRIFLLVDYDGTLTPIVARPELAELSEATRGILRQLSKSPRFMITIISGRSLADLKARVDIDGLVYAGNHGFEIEGPGLSYTSPWAEEIVPLFRELETLLKRSLNAISGVLVENKGLTLSVHYRLAKESQAVAIKSTIARILRTKAPGKVVVISGKKVFELRPASNWGKGHVVRMLLSPHSQDIKAGKILPFYLGDDTTDEDAFKEMNSSGGLSVFVGEDGLTIASYFLSSPDEVYQFLSLLVQYC